MRSEEFAVEFEAAQDDFIRLIESLTGDQWWMVGKNYPKRANEEDEGRTVAVIAHHVAVDGTWILERIQNVVAGRSNVAPNKQALNAEHARAHADTTREDVLRILRESKAPIAAALRKFTDDQLDVTRDTPIGPMTVAFSIQAVLIGHIKAHHGSIEAAIA